MSRPQAPGLSPAVRRLLSSPLVAGLATPHSVDRYLELFNPLWSLNEVRAEVVGAIRETADATTLRLRPNRNWLGARAGQYVRVTVDLDGVGRSRCYSVSSSALRMDGTIDITVRHVPGGKVSGQLATAAWPGMVVKLSQAQGDYVLPEEWPTRLVFISGGSGITPNMAMLRTLLDEHYAGHIDFLHYAPNYDEVIFGGELVDTANRATHLNLRFAVTRAEADSDDFTGHFCAEHLDALVPPEELSCAEIFVCGPQSLIDAVRAEIAARGLAARLHVESFGGTPASPQADAIGGEIRFSRAERYVASDGRTLLEQAESAGLRPDAGCRLGICMSCKCTRESGITRNVLTGESCGEPGEEIQLCVHVPVGDVTIAI